MPISFEHKRNSVLAGVVGYRSPEHGPVVKTVPFYRDGGSAAKPGRLSEEDAAVCDRIVSDMADRFRAYIESTQEPRP